ncbi:hypothetical protein GCM10010282_37870 [Streptomyces roseolus]|nr:hypothetical protein GCM10010282_37870 [Streptomyces roseolus]
MPAGGVGADGAGADAQDLGDLAGGQEIVGVLLLGQSGHRLAGQARLDLRPVVEVVAAVGEEVGDVCAEVVGVLAASGAE